MNDQVESDITIKQYLLGRLPGEDQRQLEERLLVDDDYFQQLLAIESELFDDYLSGALDAQERERFETHFLSTPDRYQELRFAEAFRTYISATSVAAEKISSSTAPAKASSWREYIPAFLRRQNPATGLALALTLLLMVFGSWWMIAKIRRLQNQVEQLQADQTTPQSANRDLQRQVSEEHARAEQLQEELERERNERAELERQFALLRERNNTADQIATQTTHPATGGPQRSRAGVFAILLSSSMTRGTEGMKKASIPDNVASVQLVLELETNEYQSYRAVLQTAEGREVLVRDKLRTKTGLGQKTLIFTIPAELLTRGDYLLNLSGIAANGAVEKTGSYTFRILSN